MRRVKIIPRMMTKGKSQDISYVASPENNQSRPTDTKVGSREKTNKKWNQWII